MRSEACLWQMAGFPHADKSHFDFLLCLSSRQMSGEVKDHGPGLPNEFVRAFLVFRKGRKHFSKPFSLSLTKETLTLEGGLAFVSINLELHPAPFMHSFDKYSERV